MTDSRQFHEDFRRGTPRSLRAVRFANAMLSIMRDYLPSEGDILRLIHERRSARPGINRTSKSSTCRPKRTPSISSSWNAP